MHYALSLVTFSRVVLHRALLPSIFLSMLVLKFDAAAEQTSLSTEEWLHTELGPPSLQSEAQFKEGSNALSLSVSGPRTTRRRDRLGFLYREITDVGGIVVRLDRLTAPTRKPIAGLMFRSGLDDDSPTTILGFLPSGRAELRHRNSQGGRARTSSKGHVGMGSWLRVYVKDGFVSCAVSWDRFNWTEVSRAPISDADHKLVGIVASGLGGKAVATAQFSNIEVLENALPGEWISRDVGNAALVSRILEASEDSQYVFHAAGKDIWGKEDHFLYHYRLVEGDFDLSSTVAKQERTHRWAKAGLMVRGSDASDSAHALIALTPASGAAFQHRPEEGFRTYHSGKKDIKAPYHIRLVREGKFITGLVSSDGFEWLEVGRAQVNLGENVLVGYAISSKKRRERCEVVFQNVLLVIKNELADYESWAEHFGLEGPLGLPSADPDRDFLPNELEHELRMDPLQGGASSQLVWLYERAHTLSPRHWLAIRRLLSTAHREIRLCQQAPFSSDGDPDVDAEQIADFLISRKAQQGGQAHALRGRLLRLYDSNSDGRLTLLETGSILRSLRYAQLLGGDEYSRNIARWATLIRHFDLDRDGVLFGAESQIANIFSVESSRLDVQNPETREVPLP